MTRPTITIGVQPNTKLLRIERVLCMYEVPSDGAWMVWINANVDFTCGTPSTPRWWTRR